MASSGWNNSWSFLRCYSQVKILTLALIKIYISFLDQLINFFVNRGQFFTLAFYKFLEIGLPVFSGLLSPPSCTYFMAQDGDGRSWRVENKCDIVVVIVTVQFRMIVRTTVTSGMKGKYGKLEWGGIRRGIQVVDMEPDYQTPQKSAWVISISL